MSSLSYSDLRSQLTQAARMLFTAGVMSHSGHGNMSMRLPEPGQLLITATGHIRDLAPQQLAVVTFDGEPIDSPEELTGLIGSREPGDRLELEVERDDETRTVTVTLGERPT